MESHFSSVSNAYIYTYHISSDARSPFNVFAQSHLWCMFVRNQVYDARMHYSLIVKFYRNFVFMQFSVEYAKYYLPIWQWCDRLFTAFNVTNAIISTIENKSWDFTGLRLSTAYTIFWLLGLITYNYVKVNALCRLSLFSIYYQMEWFVQMITQQNTSNTREQTNAHTQHTHKLLSRSVWTFSGTWILTFLPIALFIVFKAPH